MPEGEVAFVWSEGFSGSMEWLRDVQMKKEYYKPYFAKALEIETSREWFGHASCRLRYSCKTNTMAGKANIVFPEDGACAFKA